MVMVILCLPGCINKPLLVTEIVSVSVKSLSSILIEVALDGNFSVEVVPAGVRTS